MARPHFRTIRIASNANDGDHKFCQKGASLCRAEQKVGTKVKTGSLHCPVSTARTMPSKNTARMGDKAKPLAAYRRRLCCLSLERV
jgi:hypothetical protein